MSLRAIVPGDVGKEQIKSTVIARALNSSKDHTRVFPELNLSYLSGYFVRNSLGHNMYTNYISWFIFRDLMDFLVTGNMWCKIPGTSSYQIQLCDT